MTRLSPLASVSETRAVLAAHGLSTKYSLGQNFLVNDAILQKIVALADLSSDDCVLEVGPGIGTLTIALLKNAGRVLSVERDPDLPAVLAETLAPWRDRFALLSKDALDLTADDLRAAGGAPAACVPTVIPCGASSDIPLVIPSGGSSAAPSVIPCGASSDTPSVILSGARSAESKDPVQDGGALPNKLVANLPYAVAATVVLDYFERFPSLDSATVMVQKEVADRMAAEPGSKNYGAYTVKLRLYAEPAGRFGVGPGNFFPPPRVDSAVLRLNRRPVCDDAGASLDADAVAAACVMAEAAFATRRKTLANSCKTYFAGRGPEGARIIAVLPQLFESAGIDPKLRGETLGLPEFVRLGKAYQELG